MKRSARFALAVVLLLAGLVVVPWPGHRSATPTAHAGIIDVPTPGLTDILKTPEPEKTDDDNGNGGDDGSGDDGSGDDGSGGDGGDDGGIIPGSDDSNGEGDGGGKGDGKPGGKDDGGKKGGKGGKDGLPGFRKGGKKKNKDDKIDPPDSVAGRIPGAYDTRKLVAVAAQLRGLGESAAEVNRRVFPPFIIAGPASWVDTWHAPRYGPAPGQIRQHEGQDVFCDYGDPVLSPDSGIVDFSDGGLGGITTRVHLSDGSYWYMTHLSDLNTEQFSIGDHVSPGDVLGYCGNSGNAATTPPHVHFGWYQPNGEAKNPMRPLIDWLHTAERRVLGVVSKKTAAKAKKQPIFTAARRFGDSFVPDHSEFRVAGESLWASGSDPGIGTYALAEAALRAALSTQGVNYAPVGQPANLEAHEEDEQPIGSLDPDSALARLLETRHVAVDEAGD
jgi:hypothetical protein